MGRLVTVLDDALKAGKLVHATAQNNILIYGLEPDPHRPECAVLVKALARPMSVVDDTLKLEGRPIMLLVDFETGLTLDVSPTRSSDEPQDTVGNVNHTRPYTGFAAWFLHEKPDFEALWAGELDANAEEQLKQMKFFEGITEAYQLLVSPEYRDKYPVRYVIEFLCPKEEIEETVRKKGLSKVLLKALEMDTHHKLVTKDGETASAEVCIQDELKRLEEAYPVVKSPAAESHTSQ
jgi:hypothetical protein